MTTFTPAPRAAAILLAMTGSAAAGPVGGVEFGTTGRDVLAQAGPPPFDSEFIVGPGPWFGVADSVFEDEEGNRADAHATQASSLTPAALSAAGGVSAFASAGFSSLSVTSVDTAFTLSAPTPAAFSGQLLGLALDNPAGLFVQVELRRGAALVFGFTQADLALATSADVALPGFATTLPPGAYTLLMFVQVSGFDGGRNHAGYDLAWTLPTPGVLAPLSAGLVWVSRRRRAG